MGVQVFTIMQNLKNRWSIYDMPKVYENQVPHHCTKYRQKQSIGLSHIWQKDVKLWSKNGHNYHILAQSQNLFHVHQGSTVPHPCKKYEQNQARDLGRYCGVLWKWVTITIIWHGANLYFIFSKALWYLITLPNISKICQQVFRIWHKDVKSWRKMSIITTSWHRTKILFDMHQHCMAPPYLITV